MISTEVDGALDSIVSALKTLSALDFETLDATERLQIAQRYEVIDRPTTVHRNDIAVSLTRCEIADLGDRPDKALADWLRITPTEARRRIKTTQPLTARTVISQTLPPLQPATANAWRRGELDEQHVRIIQGQHNGLPVTIIATATIQDLGKATGHATTGAGTRLPMTDLIRMASHSYHYLALFNENNGRPLYFGRTKRIATPDQRLLLHATDRGCTYPGCNARLPHRSSSRRRVGTRRINKHR